MGTGRGNQEVLSEQRQNRGNLRHAPPQLQHFMSVPPGSQRGHLDIFELLWRGPYGSHGRAPCRAAISIRSCFSGSEERGQREGRENAPDSLWRNSEPQKDVLWNMSDNLSETLRSAVSWRLFFRSDCSVTLISHSAYRVRGWYLIHKTHSQSILCRNRITAITSVLWHNTKQCHLQKNYPDFKHFFAHKSISGLC